MIALLPLLLLLLLPPEFVAAGCESSWSEYEGSCYLILNNSNQQYDDITVCRAECEVLGGRLGSIHSSGENAFVYSLLRPGSPIQSQTTWLGARTSPHFE